ncbi:hypothetical protein PFWH6_1512 [Pseudomonas fluorescens WH6]|nr:hypothetical protein PFWH6_1512 [Pseudomonas fluorescens WH6]
MRVVCKNSAHDGSYWAISGRQQGYASCCEASSRRNVERVSAVNLLHARRTAP